MSTREKRVFHEGLNDLVFWYFQYVFTIHAQLILDHDTHIYDAYMMHATYDLQFKLFSGAINDHSRSLQAFDHTSTKFAEPVFQSKKIAENCLNLDDNILRQ